MPAVVEKLTGTLFSGLPLISRTTAVIAVVPPSAGTSVGFALTITRPTAAAPTRILIAFVPLADTPPESAVMVAVPEPPPATNFTETVPLTSVSAWDG